ncbi:methyltransferase domain-containing protein [Clostridioides difficile]|uniref:methyltransferase domain-containing protein n=1 Tax=Clostridioides difficile TaxID=1496 RepID=UPI003F8D1F09
MQAEAHELPYAEGFFDAVISIDSYHYFGNKEGFLDNHISPLNKWFLIVSDIFNTK